MNNKAPAIFSKLGIVSDHAGVAYKAFLVNELEAASVDVTDFGPTSSEPIDYPDAVTPMCQQIADGTLDGGIAICGSGHGVCITANKFDGLRAFNPTTIESCRVGRLHNNATVLCLGARFIDEATAREIIKVFLETSFEAGRHERRVKKIHQLETRKR